MSYRKDWMSDDQWACAEMLADIYGGFHHLYSDIKEHGTGIEISTTPFRLATFDFSALTVAIFMAHDRMIRLSLDQSGPRMIKLVLHRRHKREGKMHERHPTIETALAMYRERFPKPQTPNPRANEIRR